MICVEVVDYIRIEEGRSFQYNDNFIILGKTLIVYSK